MNQQPDSIDFNFTWQALKLLGKSLYSNAWSALSELVANGFDAGARSVFVLIDVRDKAHSLLQIADLGRGMTGKDIQVYATIGYDRRAVSAASGAYDPDIMGRKGIGKLAALYLSDEYYIKTKVPGQKGSAWRLSREQVDDNSTPALKKVAYDAVVSQVQEWDESCQGTLLELRDVDLTGLGEVAFDSLSVRLANRFLFDSVDGREVYICIRSNEKPVVFKPARKRIAFKNLSGLMVGLSNRNSLPNEVQSIIDDPPIVQIPYTRKGDELFEKRAEIVDFEDARFELPALGEYEARLDDIVDANCIELRKDVDCDGETVKIPYQLTGWIGCHATIDKAAACRNDKRFSKSKFYNPSQIRLYVRNKLAIDDLMPYLGITHAFSNYIEGEVSFDLLDDDLLPDIATSSRQGFDTLDNRWELLLRILKPRVNALIRQRAEVAGQIREHVKRENEEESAKAKEQAAVNFRQELESVSGLSDEAREEVAFMQASQLEGDVDLKAKSDYVVFLSHRSLDKALSDFIYYLLLHRGAEDGDFFYSTAEPNPEMKYEQIESLAKQIRKSIVSQNTLMAFVTGNHFRESEYCLFEAGAGWATRTVREYQILADEYRDIPAYLSEGQDERCLRGSNGCIELNKENYGRVATLLNTLIKHINKGRAIRGEELILEFKVPRFPDKVELKRLGKSEIDFMDPDFVDYWNEYVLEYVCDLEKKKLGDGKE